MIAINSYKKVTTWENTDDISYKKENKTMAEIVKFFQTNAISWNFVKAYS